MKRRVTAFLLLLALSSQFVYADWPMAGHDNQRTSYSSEDVTPTSFNQGCGMHTFADYIPTKVQLITVDRGTTDSMIYVATAGGVYALRHGILDNTSNDFVWTYPTSMPVGHSPTVDKTNNVIYIPVLDKTIHAVNALTGQLIWQTDSAGGGFLTSPLVANNLVYAGNRDGYVYAFNTSDGTLAWSYYIGAPVDYSPAISADNSVLYIGAMNSKAYALNALTGSRIAESVQFQGSGFFSFWPVVHTSANRVLFAKSLNYPENYVDEHQRSDNAVYPETPENLSTQGFMDWYALHPEMKSLLVLNPATLAEEETAPHLWWGNASGNRYPPAISGDGTVWALSAWRHSAAVYFPQGNFMGWVIGAATFTPEPSWSSGADSEDEPKAFSIIGNIIWHGAGGDGTDQGGYTSLTSTSYRTWSDSTLYGYVGSYWVNWSTYRYGNGLSFASNPYPNNTGTHGNQNPPVPLRGYVYINRSNAVICLRP
ncbi:hypothetical protein A2415_01000 [candidate division WWE3 bacterium RIFOXYC1_FULL_39_7]|uniref:Pyrrolo-quinoline quinone repeat domain-containing protein n=2 Tax=Katanobacteria TaxID=422282 RepID=A0A1F4X4P2_UNCKA|nr:MAG: hypothetical protein A2415_01000 [candidate division WWE3 bacterium RIFOXYC1_FULL_39_7]OGC76694.1 MAG: hypothetical protein A2619_05555 [candidate division WWE3 bacterium RIFOXYD1_FULL_39_9]